MHRIRVLSTMTVAAILFIATATHAAEATPTCPAEFPAVEAAKSHKLFLYFPTTNDTTFPKYEKNVSPARVFKVSELDSTIGTTAQLRSRIFDIVSDDYCEFNVQVLNTTTNPATHPSPPMHRSTIAIGSDSNGSNAVGWTWGSARDTSVADVDFARVWGGTYGNCPGTDASMTNGCSVGTLSGANSTLDHWAQAIGGTAAHEGGHTYGLAHADDDPATDPIEPGPPPTPGEDSYHRHTMPAGRHLSGNDRVDYRRHFSDHDFGILATNVGLSISTMHNWDLVNPNAVSAQSLTMNVLSVLPTITIDWSYEGSGSPWTTPIVSSASGTTVYHGVTYNNYTITWSTPNGISATPGVIAGGARFHIGTTFTSVDFNAPDAIIITDITLHDVHGSALALHPRLPGYDCGTPDTTDETFGVNFTQPRAAPPLEIENISVQQLPRVASIESMVGSGVPYTFDKRLIRPWSKSICQAGLIGETGYRCIVARLRQGHHITDIRQLGQRGVVSCRNGVPAMKKPAASALEFSQDANTTVDDSGFICAGTFTDPFPSTTVYLIATIVDPWAKHYDPQLKHYIVGPLRSRIFLQFAGIRNTRKMKYYDNGREAYLNLDL